MFAPRRVDKELTIFPAIAEEPPTPLWELILEQFKDQLVLILLGSAAVSFGLAVFDGGEGWTAFVDPAVVRISGRGLDFGIWLRLKTTDPYHSNSQRRRRSLSRKQ